MSVTINKFSEFSPALHAIGVSRQLSGNYQAMLDNILGTIYTRLYILSNINSAKLKLML